MPIETLKLKKYLLSIKTILQQAKINPPPCFISYAWESGEDNKKLQSWLSNLKEDLESVGIKTFLDIYNMHGNMRDCMETNIREGGFILIIGTPKFKDRVEQDRLYKMPRVMFDIRMELNSFNNIRLSKDDFKGKAVVLIDGEDTLYFIEGGKILHEERAMGKTLNIEGISWKKIDRYDTYVADISKQVNDIIDQAKDTVKLITQEKSKTFGASITNVAFEFGFTLEKGKQNSSALIPLLYKGNFTDAFPADILKENLILDMRKKEDYGRLLIGLSNPIGIIPTICSQLLDNQDYRQLVDSLLNLSDIPEIIGDERELTDEITILARDFFKYQKLGEGSYGIVYKGEWANKPVAIKELKTGKIPDRALIEFKKESFIIAQYRHPNIVQLYGICLSQPYSIIMEFLNGSLFDWLHNSKPLDWPKKYKIATDVAVGLSFLHENDIIHQGIKSLNVLLDEQLNAKLSDYGLTKIKTYSGVDTSVAVCLGHDSAGKVLWQAPELFIKRGASFSSASDVYSYGILLWEIVSHKLPFANAGEPDKVQRMTKSVVKEVIPLECPASLAEIINLCCELLPEARPNITTIVERLERLEKDTSVEHMESLSKPVTEEIDKLQEQFRQASIGSRPASARVLRFSPPTSGIEQKSYIPNTKASYKQSLKPEFNRAQTAEIKQSSYIPDTKASYKQSLKPEISKSQQVITIEDPKDLNKLGENYYNGTDEVTQNYEKAAEYFRKAADAGYAVAQFNLGTCYRSGNGVIQDYISAANWFLKAATQGDADAQNILGSYYTEGRLGLEKDPKQGIEWFNRAAQQGNVLAEFNLAIYYHKIDDYKMAFKWYSKAASHNHLEAQYWLGLFYEKGWGTDIDFDKANEFYVMAANQGHKKALERKDKLFILRKQRLCSPSIF